MRPYAEYVELLQSRDFRLEAMRVLAGGSLNARESRGKVLEPEAIQALIAGLDHVNPAVRRCCLEILDAHPDSSAVPSIMRKLDDPVPRVRWHAVHALACDPCKVGESFVTGQVLALLKRVAETDSNGKVRAYAAYELSKASS